MQTATRDTPDVHRWTLEDYHRMIESGGFAEDARVELIDGLIVDMSPKTREHERAVDWLHRWLVRAMDHDRYFLRVGGALTLARSEPEPDFAVIEDGTPDPYHPATATLVIEVAMSSHRRDLGRKVTLYAEAGVGEYWVVDLKHKRLVIHRDPRDGRYQTVFEVPADGSAKPVVLELPAVEVAALFAAALS